MPGTNSMNAAYVCKYTWSWSIDQNNYFSLNRTSSPRAGASTGLLINLSPGTSSRTGSVTVYYGDVILVHGSVQLVNGSTPLGLT